MYGGLARKYLNHPVPPMGTYVGPGLGNGRETDQIRVQPKQQKPEPSEDWLGIDDADESSDGEIALKDFEPTVNSESPQTDSTVVKMETYSMGPYSGLWSSKAGLALLKIPGEKVGARATSDIAAPAQEESDDESVTYESEDEEQKEETDQSQAKGQGEESDDDIDEIETVTSVDDLERETEGKSSSSGESDTHIPVNTSDVLPLNSESGRRQPAVGKALGLNNPAPAGLRNPPSARWEENGLGVPFILYIAFGGALVVCGLLCYVHWRRGSSTASEAGREASVRGSGASTPFDDARSLEEGSDTTSHAGSKQLPGTLIAII